MLDETKYESAMQMIMHAGNAKSSALLAIDDAAEGDFAAAETDLAEAAAEMHSAHDLQLSLIQQEASGTPVELSLILVHAEDHLTMAILATDMATRMVELYRRLPAAAAGEKDDVA